MHSSLLDNERRVVALMLIAIAVLIALILALAY